MPRLGPERGGLSSGALLDRHHGRTVAKDPVFLEPVVGKRRRESVLSKLLLSRFGLRGPYATG